MDIAFSVTLEMLVMRYWFFLRFHFPAYFPKLLFSVIVLVLVFVIKYHHQMSGAPVCLLMVVRV